MNDEVQQLKEQVKSLKEELATFASEMNELKTWKKKKETQQIQEPLDDASQIVIDNRRIRTGFSGTFTNGDSDTVTVVKGIITKIA